MKKTDILVKDYIAPVLKKHGFKKRRHSWNRHKGELVDIINIRHTQGSMPNEERIYFNVSIAIPKFIKIIWNKESTFIDEVNGIIRFRLHRILEKDGFELLRYDGINVDEKLMDNIDKLVEVIENKLIPFLDRNKTYEDLYNNYLLVGGYNGYAEKLYLFLLLYYLDKTDELNELMNELLKSGWKDKFLEVRKEVFNE